jgi:hypothetical protein
MAAGTDKLCESPPGLRHSGRLQAESSGRGSAGSSSVQARFSLPSRLLPQHTYPQVTEGIVNHTKTTSRNVSPMAMANHQRPALRGGRTPLRRRDRSGWSGRLRNSAIRRPAAVGVAQPSQFVPGGLAVERGVACSQCAGPSSPRSHWSCSPARRPRCSRRSGGRVGSRDRGTCGSGTATVRN